MDALVARSADQLAGLPPTVTKVLMPDADPTAEDIAAALLGAVERTGARVALIAPERLTGDPVTAAGDTW